jgi:hypothetical protein
MLRQIRDRWKGERRKAEIPLISGQDLFPQWVRISTPLPIPPLAFR